MPSRASSRASESANVPHGANANASVVLPSIRSAPFFHNRLLRRIHADMANDRGLRPNKRSRYPLPSKRYRPQPKPNTARLRVAFVPGSVPIRAGTFCPQISPIVADSEIRSAARPGWKADLPGQLASCPVTGDLFVSDQRSPICRLTLPPSSHILRTIRVSGTIEGTRSTRGRVPGGRHGRHRE